MDEIRFRWMTYGDIDDVLAVEMASFSAPWSREAFENEMTINQFAKYLLLEVDGTVAGYCGLWLVMDEAHITNVAVVPELRGRKLGEKLMVKVMDMLRDEGVKMMTLEVRVSNHIAQSLYEKLGFSRGGIRKNYYSDNGEDALVMWVKLNEQ
ncbi:ribosomal protein S18-alanine N-acetyltransferase [Jeotgalibacillus haloalkalitolerans]|uniref:[Ribosomal protein bS18]-alanine N-acetyltransferase n=1 Tax=Jeotgalibacillus haloalkalitolerans TaxID=3104292 RepID=A0ABU5KNN8_9BACL|nr:ribosomal protein S18-alanine N-acetyltransferase [Jeotgalibacillus sp. HH7-29]MDZ5712571.1 ribosomal protein S18-alanine N-acetyltransferase [Jeotgalibacillus sp. HH7-29]